MVGEVRLSPNGQGATKGKATSRRRRDGPYDPWRRSEIAASILYLVAGTES